VRYRTSPSPLDGLDGTFVQQLDDVDVGLVEGEELVELGQVRSEDDARDLEAVFLFS